MKLEKYTKKHRTEIQWLSRYSTTMEDDKHGRWARIAYAGKFSNMGIFRKKICRWEIAWIKKLIHEGTLKFTVHYLYPSNGSHVFDSIEQAKKEVNKTFRWFIKMSSNK